MSRSKKKPLSGVKAWSKRCRNHGACGYCAKGRRHKIRRRSPAPDHFRDAAKLVPDINSDDLIPTEAERIANHKAIMKMHRANRFRLMFGQPLLPETKP